MATGRNEEGRFVLYRSRSGSLEREMCSLTNCTVLCFFFSPDEAFYISENTYRIDIDTVRPNFSHVDVDIGIYIYTCI